MIGRLLVWRWRWCDGCEGTGSCCLGRCGTLSYGGQRFCFTCSCGGFGGWWELRPLWRWFVAILKPREPPKVGPALVPATAEILLTKNAEPAVGAKVADFGPRRRAPLP